MHKTIQRGMTIPELLISFGILLLVLGFATALFRQAFTHVALTTENMTNEQSARIGMAKVNASLSQASVDVNSADTSGTPSPAVISSLTPATSSPSIAFFRVQTLDPAAIPTNSSKAPDPAYKVHIISYDAPTKVVNEYVTDWATYSGGGASPAPTVIAHDVTDFGVMQISAYEYQFQITVNNILNPQQAEKPYTLVDNVELMH